MKYAYTFGIDIPNRAGWCMWLMYSLKQEINLN